MNEKKKILIVEDEVSMANALKLKLNKEGFDAQVAFNGTEGFQMIKDGNFDLVLLDLVMPEKGGFYVLENVQKEGLKTKIVISSNLSQPEDLEKAKKLGAVDYFIKSDTPIVKVVEKVKEHLQIA